MPERIQLRRTKGWRKPAGAVIVSRPSRWGSPFPVDGDEVPDVEPAEPEQYYPTGERNYTRVIPADDKQGRLGAVLMQEEGLESVFIIDDRETYGQGLADQFEMAAQELGIEVLERIKQTDEQVEVILVTAVKTVKTAVAAMNALG